MDKSNAVVELVEGVNLKNLLTGVDFTTTSTDVEYGLTEDFNEINTGDKHFYGQLMGLDDDVVRYENISEIKDKMKDVTDDGKLKKMVLRVGEGKHVGDDVVLVHYVSYTEMDPIPFDSTYMRSMKPERFKLGCGSNYEGFDLAIKSMMEGEISVFMVHPDLAFKSLGIPPRIPENATVVIEIQLVKVISIENEIKESEETSFMDKYSFEEVYKKAKICLLHGNENFSKDDISSAAKNYRKAEKILNTCKLKSDKEEMQWYKVLLKVYVNLCVCYNHPRVAKPALVCLFAREAFETLPDATKSAKLYFQLGKAKLFFSDYKQAKQNFLKALRLNEGDPEILHYIQLVENKQETEHLDDGIKFNPAKKS